MPLLTTNPLGATPRPHLNPPQRTPTRPTTSQYTHIRDPLRLTHPLPHRVLLLVPPHIVAFGKQNDKYGQDVDGEQPRVAFAVVGFVVVEVDEGVGYVAYLDGYLWMGVGSG